MQIFINTYGTYLHVRDDMFEIKVKGDKTKPPKVNHIAAHKITSFILSKGSSITTDAVALALRHNIDIVLVEKDGHPMGRFWHSKLGSTTKIRKRQLQASMDQEGLKYVKSWIVTKLENQSDFINDLKKNRPALQVKLEQRIASILELRTKIAQVDGSSVNDVADSIRGWEGSAGRHYFESLSMCMPSSFAFKGRSFRPAKDQFNAMLNYAYGILYSRVERGLMLAGLDPYVGFMHRDDYNTKSLVFDYIEVYRIHAERFVFRLFSGKKINKAFFDEVNGAVSLNPEGKAFFVSPYLEYLDSEKIRYAGRNQTRMNALQMEAHKFANMLIEKKEI